MYKRKRSAAYSSGPSTYKKRRKTSGPYVVPGKTRVGGYYGRFGKSGELKFHDVDVTNASVANTGNIMNMGTINVIPQGVTESERVGRKCTIKTIQYRSDLKLPERDEQTTPPGGDIVRVIVYLDKQANGAAAAVTDILETADYNSYMNLSNSGRFVIMHDKFIPINYMALAGQAAGDSASSETLKQFSFYKRCNIPIEFSGTTGAIGEIRSNNLGILLISEAGNLSMDGKVRLRFSDN